MKPFIIIASTVLILMAGCREKETTVNNSSQVAEETIRHAQSKEVWEKDIQLNQGTQWPANRETTEGILEMTRLVSEASLSSPEEYRKLGNALNEEKNLVIKRCTMKGPSHDNLHIYLQPLIGKIGELQEVDSAEKGEQLISEIQQHLEAYHSYFI